MSKTKSKCPDCGRIINSYMVLIHHHIGCVENVQKIMMHGKIKKVSTGVNWSSKHIGCVGNNYSIELFISNLYSYIYHLNYYSSDYWSNIYYRY